MTINTTLVRKLTTTTVHENLLGLKADAANLMCHSEKTAQKSYHLSDKHKKAFSTSQLIKQALRTDFNVSEGNYSQTTCNKISKNDLEIIFEKEIENGEIGISVVPDRIETDDRLNIHSWNEKSVKALLDSVRYLTCSNNKRGSLSVHPEGEKNGNIESKRGG